MDVFWMNWSLLGSGTALFYGLNVLPVTQPTNSVNKQEAMTPISSLILPFASSFHDPSPHTCQKGRHFF